jgi:hypothetical protein
MGNIGYFSWNAHAGDVGHTLVFGSTGAGKPASELVKAAYSSARPGGVISVPLSGDTTSTQRSNPKA